ncbi:MAG: hypothetical protein HY904_14395 [Deltaproteobacteria bacterium]|nr:hypothetical protein [Deltaproteobacteria bacterium]
MSAAARSLAARLRAAPHSVATLSVRLAGIPLRRQGTHDSLCAYYAAATALCALHPWMAEGFDASRAEHDPLLAHLPRRGRSLDALVTGALFTGLHLRDLATAMNRVCRGTGTLFQYRVLHRRAVAQVAAPVLAGLPAVLGWEGPEIGNHTVVVHGVKRARGAPRTWLELLDPALALDAVEWGQLVALAGGTLEAILCVRHAGMRPDRVTTAKGPGGNLVRSHCRVERLDPRTERWTALVAPA